MHKRMNSVGWQLLWVYSHAEMPSTELTGLNLLYFLVTIPSLQ